MWLQVCAVARVIACIINRQIMMALLSLGLNAQVLWEHYMQHVHDLNCLLEGSEGSLRVRPHTWMHVVAPHMHPCMWARSLPLW